VKVFIVHVYDAADKLHDYYVYQRIERAVQRAAADVTHNRFEGADPDFIAAEICRVLAAIEIEPGAGRRHVRCDSWRAHIDEMQVLS
jgi:hypothetical protein